MVLILLSWCYIAFTLLNWGILWELFTGSQKASFFSTTVHGLFGITFFTSIWCFFFNTGWLFSLSILVVNLILFAGKFTLVKEHFQNSIQTLSKKATLQQFYVIAFIVLLALLCTKTPLLIDNETYYIQTIKWLNEYGYVQGLGNFHLFFGQTSGWHGIQSAFNFSFAVDNLNDMSGFIVVLGVIASQTEKTTNELAQNFYKAFPWVALLLFPFIAAPSPDVAVVVLTYFLFTEFVASYNNPKQNTIQLQTLLALLIVFYKVTAFPLLVLPLLTYKCNRNYTKREVWMLIGFAVSFLLIFLTKNYYLTGYPLFPYQGSIHTPIHAVPKQIMDFYFSTQRMYSFAFTASEWQSYSLYEKVVRLLNPTKYYGLAYWLTILLCIVFPIQARKSTNAKPLLLLYGLFVIQIAVLVFTSPQWRFELHFLMFMGIYISLSFLRTTRLNFSMPVILVLFSIAFFPPIPFGNLKPEPSFSFYTIWIPSPTSKLKPNDYHPVHLGNLMYYSPPKTAFFWQTGNGPLPCVNQIQIRFNAKQFGYIPQYLHKTPDEGFYSQKIKP